MYHFRTLLLFSSGAVLLLGADIAWKTKAVPEWTEDDARQILYDSPWAKSTVASIARLQTEDERRAGGNMGQAHGVGYDGINNGKVPLPTPASFYGGKGGDGKRTGQDKMWKLRLVWESALPVHLAELKSKEFDPPTLPGEGYSVVVYGVPGTYFKGDPKKLGEPLKQTAWLKREGKKDVKPDSVEVFVREDGPVVVYVFPYSMEITKSDGYVQFAGQIGRLLFAQNFAIGEMVFQGKPAL